MAARIHVRLLLPAHLCTTKRGNTLAVVRSNWWVLDDRAVNVEGARQAGLRGVRFTGASALAVDAAIRGLPGLA